MWDSKRDTDVKNRLLDSVGEGKGGMIWENSVETYILWNRPPVQVRCMKQGIQGRDDPEGWGGEGSGRALQDGEHMCTHGWFMSMYGKNHYNIVK